MVERVDYYSDDEYEQALAWEEESYKEEQARDEYEREYAYLEYINSKENA
jgi:hypothetical protein